MGSLLRVDPLPWLWLGLGILAWSLRLVAREIRQMKARSSHMESVAVSLIRRGEIEDAVPLRPPVELAPGNPYDPYARANQQLKRAP